MNRKKFILPISLLLFVILAVFVYFYFFKPTPEEPKPDDSVFSEIIEPGKETSQSSPTLPPERKIIPTSAVDDYLASVSAVFELEKQKKPLPEWEYQNTRIQATISSVYPDESKIRIKIVYPKDKEFSTNYKNVDVKCEDSQSASFLQDFRVLDTNINFLKVAQPKDNVSAFCLDPNCDSIGRECILIKGIK